MQPGRWVVRPRKRVQVLPCLAGLMIMCSRISWRAVPVAVNQDLSASAWRALTSIHCYSLQALKHGMYELAARYRR